MEKKEKNDGDQTKSNGCKSKDRGTENDRHGDGSRKTEGPIDAGGICRDHLGYWTILAILHSCGKRRAMIHDVTSVNCMMYSHHLGCSFAEQHCFGLLSSLSHDQIPFKVVFHTGYRGDSAIFNYKPTSHINFLQETNFFLNSCLIQVICTSLVVTQRDIQLYIRMRCWSTKAPSFPGGLFYLMIRLIFQKVCLRALITTLKRT
ncbi:uncharacterized protein LOC132645201 isoform X2 [Lycium barbarum]|uniref:uncharacterized protein LOC132645201 isoform X2 n=1 Tax=Lycium barbarum TaxID=112863 RepID=UPI00293E453A|nr:uncharacterized protein LOC132645201 isoform X2 [Lycium barbarum]